MRRRSERKKSTDVLSPPTAPKRTSGRRSHRSSSSQSETRKSSKSEEATASNDIVNDESNTSVAVKTNERQLRRRSCSSPRVEEKKKSPLREQPELEAIPELPAENNSESPDETPNENNSTSLKQIEREQTPENVTSDTKENHAESASMGSPKAEATDKVIEREESPEKLVRRPAVENEVDEAVQQKENHAEPTASEDSVPEKQTKTEKEQNISPEKETPPAIVEHKKTFSRSRERRSHVVEKANDEPENDENKEVNNKSPKKTSIFVTPSNEKTQNTRKRRWLSKRSSDSNSQILAISTDSLKNLISDVHPVPLCDVKLESSSDVEEVESEREEGEASPTPQKPRSAKSSSYEERERKPSLKYEQPTRKISIVNDGYEPMVQPIPTKKEISNILYITNLVRPFTILQLKGLLARTGKIVENRFWIDKIKSKCYVQYETEDEAVETRHALHGVRWPTSNPKCLNVDFGTDAEMEKAMATTQESGPQYGQDIGRENRIIGTGWDRDRFDFEEKKVQVGRPVREWDVGKREELESEAERAREREKRREGERSERVIHNERADKDNARGRDRGDRDRDRDRKRHSSDRDHRRSLSASPARKIKKKSNDPPLRLLDDLFRKTKTTPCIYWLPLTPEQIAEKEAFRLRRIAEQQERIKLRELEKEKEREKERDREREREKDRRRERDRSNGHRRSLSRDRRRY